MLATFDVSDERKGDNIGEEILVAMSHTWLAMDFSSPIGRQVLHKYGEKMASNLMLATNEKANKRGETEDLGHILSH